MKKPIKLVFVQLGSPKSPKTGDVRRYLREFLGDRRVVDLNPFLWKIILNFFILPFRPKHSASLYRNIWNGSSFPLIDHTEKFCENIASKLPEYEIKSAYVLSSPRVEEVLGKDDQCDNVLIIPLYPQFSESTTASVVDRVFAAFKKRHKIPTFKILSSFHKSKAFIDNSVLQIEKVISNSSKEIDHLVLSFHGIPKRRVVTQDDPYYIHCFETFFLLRSKVSMLSKTQVSMCFQSRFGSEEWLTPYAEDHLDELILAGKKNIAIYSPSFVADCLETQDELGRELANEVEKKDAHLHFIPCLNSNGKWCDDMADLAKSELDARITDLDHENEMSYQLKPEDYQDMEQPKLKSAPLTPKAKSSLKIVFLTLFLDLVGFSIIFPLFPAVAKYYLKVDADNYFLQMIFGGISRFAQTGGMENMSSIVLFGGALGALYSLLQFIAAPIWGEISDRMGRKPVLLVSVAFLGLSYLLWFFSGSFTLLILARFIGGIMGGNISTATAVVADVTDKSNRSKGMATIGIAFALGFIIGPALGGILSLVDLTTIYPKSIEYGVNPFSMPALLAMVLSFINLFYLWRKFEETLPVEKRGKHHTDRSFNPIKLFKPLPYPGLNLTNVSYFIFLAAFSGMEFTLTFLAVERLGYTSMDNAYMFIFIGFILAMVQGGVVRRKAHIIGEKKMVTRGLITLIPGLLIIAFAHNSYLLYLGLFFLAVGSSMTIPCLTSLVSMYTPAQNQGKAIGIFRSLGALARVVGPIMAAIIYWKSGAKYPYLLGSLILILPIILVFKLPPVPRDEDLATK